MNNQTKADRMTDYNSREVLTEKEAALFLRRSPRTLEYWRAVGKGPPYVKDRRITYLKGDLRAYLQACRVVPTPQETT
jgi:hypothetical protein